MIFFANFKKFNITKDFENVKILHKSPDEVDSLYYSSDLFLIPIRHGYLKIASPTKFYEPLGYAIPFLIVTDDNFSEVSKFVKREDIGFLINYSPNEVAKFLDELSKDKEILMKKKKIS